MAGTGGNPRTEVTSVTVSLEDVGSAGLAAETVAVFEMGPNTAGAVTVIVNATLLSCSMRQRCTLPFRPRLGLSEYTFRAPKQTPSTLATYR